MCSHKVKTSPCFSMILELQKQRDIHSNAKNIDLDLAVSSICPFGQMTSIRGACFPLRETGMRRLALRGGLDTKHIVSKASYKNSVPWL